MPGVDVRTYLAADETLQRCWNGATRDGGIETGVVGVTDRRLLFCSEAGTFWDVTYEHISVFESHAKTRTDIDGVDYRALVGGGAALSTVGFVGAIGASSGFVALVFVLLLIGGLVTAEHGWKHQAEYDGFERRERPVQRVSLTTSTGQRLWIELFTTDSVGAEIGRLVRAGIRSGTGRESGLGPESPTEFGSSTGSESMTDQKTVLERELGTTCEQSSPSQLHNR